MVKGCDGWHYIQELALELEAGNVRAVSDGSTKEGFGTAAWVLESKTNPKAAISGNNITPGTPADQSSGRSELAGLYGIAVATQLITSFYGIQQGSISVGCDGLNQV